MSASSAAFTGRLDPTKLFALNANAQRGRPYFLNVEISEDGQTWTTLDKSSGSADWTLQTIDLQPYEGKTVQVRFRVQTDASVNSGGVRIDNVVVAGDPA